MKPLIIYVDDEPHNLTVFEAAMPSEWEILTFDSPLSALEKINKVQPWVVLSDQRMPNMNGVNFLEIVRKVNNTSIRAIVTGFSEEDLVVESIRKAQIFDYIRKPWDVDDLVHRIAIMIDTYKLEQELIKKNSELTIRNNELEELNKKIAAAKDREEKLRRELEAWAPPFIINTINNDTAMQFPKKKDLAVMTFDIVNSSQLHGVNFQNRSIRAQILEGYTQCIIKNGGWRESSSGDSAYAHFGMIKELDRPADCAYAAASEFRVFLRSLSQVSGVSFECGVAIHYAPNCIVDVHEIKTQAFTQEVIHKSLQSSSVDIDLVHRMEKLMHELQGSNIAMSKEFYEKLSVKPPGVFEVGFFKFKGQSEIVEIVVKPSDKVRASDLEILKKSNHFAEENKDKIDLLPLKLTA